jgi:hypothetical protein
LLFGKVGGVDLTKIMRCNEQGLVELKNDLSRFQILEKKGEVLIIQDMTVKDGPSSRGAPDLWIGMGAREEVGIGSHVSEPKPLLVYTPPGPLELESGLLSIAVDVSNLGLRRFPGAKTLASLYALNAEYIPVLFED